MCRSVSVRIGLSPSDVWAGNPDVGAVEVVELVNEAQRLVADAGDWPVLQREAKLSRPAGGTTASLALPDDCARILPGTLRCGGLRPLPGPLSADAWAMGAEDAPALPAPGWALLGGRLLLRGLPAGGEDVSYRYVAAVPALTADKQVSLLDERVVMLAAVMLYRDAKGLPAGAAPSQYLAALGAAQRADAPVGRVNLGGRRGPVAPDFVERRNTIVLNRTVLG